MSKAFAEQIIDGMVNENGMCGERGLSEKQFDILSQYLEEGEWEHVKTWKGSRGGTKEFTQCEYSGNIGKYYVVLNWFQHFNAQYTVKSISLRPKDEYETERHIEEALRFEHSEWVAAPKKRLDLELTVLRKSGYIRDCYSGYGDEMVNIYTMTDDDGNCYVWKSTNVLLWKHETEDGYIVWDDVEVGEKVRMRATVKEHTEWHGTKQTVIIRPTVSAII